MCLTVHHEYRIRGVSLAVTVPPVTSRQARGMNQPRRLLDRAWWTRASRFTDTLVCRGVSTTRPSP